MFHWTVTPNQAWGALANAQTTAIRRAIRLLARRYAAEIEAYMKANASWVDRSGNARQSLHTEVKELGMDMVEIILAHGVSYGWHLEVGRNAGRYAIISPTIDVFGPRIWQDVQALLRR
jgi:hypothetical protein